ncbi:hypothetical protein P8610_12705 [Fictibacillus sp. UD]|uniref:hypothetical protein n=1 Tax=Fictibacillus sp. UD TaxID=3038777 RepID=UPI003746C1AB
MEQARKRKKKRHIIISLIIMSYCLLCMGSKYDTFAWFTTQSYAEGRITNAMTADLLKIDLGKVKYLENCQVQSSLKITNISNIDIPIKLDLLSDSQSNHSKSKVLKPGQSIVSATKDTDYLPSCESTEIKYHLFGFQGYVDEEIVIPLDSAKMIKPVELPQEEKVEENKTEDQKNEEKQQPEVKKEEPVQTEQPATPEQPAAPEQTQPETNTPAPPAESTPTPPVESPATTNQTTNTENNQPAAPTTQTVEPPATESKEDAQKDA